MFYRSKHINVLLVSAIVLSAIGISSDSKEKDSGDEFLYARSSSPVYVSSIVPMSIFLDSMSIDEEPEEKEEVVEEIVIPEGLNCPQFYLMAKEVGWPEDQLERLDYVMWRESRCQTDAHNTYDPVSGSRGVIQINGFWCKPNSYTSRGYLQDNGVLSHCDDLFDPVVNLQAGLSIYKYGIEKHGCGWGPWSTKRSAWCKS